MTAPDYRGYHDCPCRDCFDVAIGGALDSDGNETDAPALCNDCEDAGCDADGNTDCQRDDAFEED